MNQEQAGDSECKPRPHGCQTGTSILYGSLGLDPQWRRPAPMVTSWIGLKQEEQRRGGGNREVEGEVEEARGKGRATGDLMPIVAICTKWVEKLGKFQDSLPEHRGRKYTQTNPHRVRMEQGQGMPAWMSGEQTPRHR
eukprot:750180-Hanusia_phi.AAC.3